MSSSSSFSSTSLSTFVPPLMKDEEPRNWADLPSEVTSSILIRLSVTDILDNAQKVCSPWRRVCKDPSMWRKIDMSSLMKRYGFLDRLASMCRHAVDRSQGGLVEIHLQNFVNDDLLDYIADRSSNLKSLGFPVYYPMTTNKGLMNAITKLPLLETLEFFDLAFKLDLKAIGHACPQLKTLKLNSSGLSYEPLYSDDDDDRSALAVAESMPKLRHLQLLGDRITNIGLNAILDSCPHLEHLDLRQCFNIDLVRNLEKKCLERIKELRRPEDSTADYPYDITFVSSDSDDDYLLTFGPLLTF